MSLDLSKIKKNLLKNILICFVISLFFALLLGANVWHIFVWLFLYTIIASLGSFIILIKNKFEFKEEFIKKLMVRFSLLLFLILFLKVQSYLGESNFDYAIDKIKEHKAKIGFYPKDLSEIDVNENPYISLLGPDLIYRPLMVGDGVPIFCLVYMSPFGRNCYDFKRDRRVIVD